MQVLEKRILSVVLYLCAFAFLGLGIVFLQNPFSDGGPLWGGFVQCVILGFMVLCLGHNLSND